MSDFEKRMLSAGTAELRALDPASEGGAPRIAGYAAVFGVRSEPMGGFVEEIMPGAFDDVLEQDVRALFNHDPNYLLGRKSSGTLRLAVDARGLAYEIDAPDTQTIRDLVLSPLQRRDLSGSSFAFRVALDGDEWREEGGLIVRTIHRFSALLDVGPVSFPAYPDASVAQRSLDAWKKTLSKTPAALAANQRSARERELELMGA